MEETLSDAGGALGSMVPMRLAVGGTRKRLPKSVADENHERVAKQAGEWQQTAGNARSWELGAVVRGTDRDRCYELVGLMASAGEQLVEDLLADPLLYKPHDPRAFRLRSENVLAQA